MKLHMMILNEKQKKALENVIDNKLATCLMNNDRIDAATFTQLSELAHNAPQISSVAGK